MVQHNKSACSRVAVFFKWEPFYHDARRGRGEERERVERDDRIAYGEGITVIFVSSTVDTIEHEHESSTL